MGFQRLHNDKGQLGEYIYTIEYTSASLHFSHLNLSPFSKIVMLDDLGTSPYLPRVELNRHKHRGRASADEVVIPMLVKGGPRAGQVEILVAHSDKSESKPTSLR